MKLQRRNLPQIAALEGKFARQVAHECNAVGETRRLSKVVKRHELFGKTLKRHLSVVGKSQRELAQHIPISDGQVSRWIKGTSLPSEEHMERIADFVGSEIESEWAKAQLTTDLYVASPITALGEAHIPEHHDMVQSVIDEANALKIATYWPGSGVASAVDYRAPDFAAEANLAELRMSDALLYVQFRDLNGPTGSLIELGIALGRDIPCTILVQEGVQLPFILGGFEGVSQSLKFLPRVRIYRVKDVRAAQTIVRGTGAALFGL